MIRLFLLLLLWPIASTASPLACLTEAIYFEAGSKGEPGRLAVGHVVMNRVKSRDFPSSVCGVISDGEASGRCQFSYRCDGLPESFTYPSQLRLAELTARAILDGAADPTGGALFFHAETIAPGWFATRERVGAFGGNVFYK